MHPLCRYLLNRLKAHESFDLVVLHELLSVLTARPRTLPSSPPPPRPPPGPSRL
jgi:hypothetical protein